MKWNFFSKEETKFRELDIHIKTYEFVRRNMEADIANLENQIAELRDDANRNAALTEKLLKQVDSLCNQIVDSTIQGVDFSWADRYLPLPSESWVHWQLRNLGFEIQCHELDIFPTNSKKLKELLYKI